VILLVATIVAAPKASAVERSEVPEKYRWNLADLFPTEAAWEKARDGIAARIADVAAYRGRLGESASVFYDALSLRMSLSEQLERVRNYASQIEDEDSRVSKSQEMKGSVTKVAVDFRTAISWMRPEILALGRDTVMSFVDAEPKLAPYRIWLDDLLRYAPHTLTTDEEAIVARTGNLTGAGGDVYSILTDADLPFPQVTLPDGRTVTLNDAAYGRYRGSADRATRKLVFREFFTAYQNFRRTLATTLNAAVKAHVFNKDVRHFDSCLSAALFGDNIPTDVYTQLIADVNANLPVLHRYLELRARMMKIDDLGYEDLYAPLVSSVDLSYTPESAMDLTLEAVAPLGADYVNVMKRAMPERWIDWMPNTGKRSGAYSTISYGVHPYQLQNFNGNYDDVSTLAHELGHSLHSYLADEHQPYVTHDYATFVAEVASTLNENLLFHSMLAEAKDDDTRLFLLGNYLEGLRTTLFRQTMFAEFELKIHEMAESGRTLTGDNLNELYLGLVRRYYGHDQGICAVDSTYAAEWAFIPHFYYNFYVFQYATSMIASSSIADAIRSGEAKGDHAARDAYLKMLASGSSDYPIDLLKGAGVDMTTSKPFRAAMHEMNQVMDEIEGILAKRGK